MYSFNSLIPLRFLSLFAHITVSICILWDSEERVLGCFIADFSEDMQKLLHSRLLWNVGVGLALLVCELLTFLSGVTMFHSTSTLISFWCHMCCVVLLVYLGLNDWLCGFVWWPVAFLTISPIVTDFIVTFWVLRHKLC